MPLIKIDILAERTEVLKYLNYSHLVEMNDKWNTLSLPNDYTLFLKM